MILKSLNYGNYGRFVIMGSAGFVLSTVGGMRETPLKGEPEPQFMALLKETLLRGSISPRVP